MLTRRDYVVLAKIVRKETVGGYIAKYSFVCAMMDYCKADNPNFDRDKFYAACYE